MLPQLIVELSRRLQPGLPADRRPVHGGLLPLPGPSHAGRPRAQGRARPAARRLEPGLMRLLGHGVAGAVTGWGVLAGLVATDAGGLGTLLARADGGWLALVLLTLQFGAGFATFAMVTAVALAGGTAR